MGRRPECLGWEALRQQTGGHDLDVLLRQSGLVRPRHQWRTEAVACVGGGGEGPRRSVVGVHLGGAGREGGRDRRLSGDGMTAVPEGAPVEEFGGTSF